MFAIDLGSGGVSELVDEHDLGSCAARRGSSSLPFPTKPDLVLGLGTLCTSIKQRN